MTYRKGVAPNPVTSFLSTDTPIIFRGNTPISGPMSALQTLLGTTSSSSSGSTAATTYTISTASTGTAGTAQTVTVATTGTLSSAVVVTLSDGASGTFGGTVTLAAGTNSSGSTQYTPASAGTRTLVGTNNGGLTNPSGPSVTVAAAASSGGGSGSLPTMTFNPTATYGTAQFGQGLTGGKGTALITFPTYPTAGSTSDDQSSFAVAFGFKSGGGANPAGTNPFLSLVNSTISSTTGQGGARFDLFASGNSLAMSGAGEGVHTASVNIRDGAQHDISMQSRSAYGYSYWKLYIDGALAANKDGAPYHFSAGQASLIIDMTQLSAGDVIDNIRVLQVDEHDVVPVATSEASGSAANKIVYFNLNGNGTGS